MGIGKARTAHRINIPGRSKIRRIKRLTVDHGPMRKYIHGYLQTPVTSQTVGAERAPQRHEVDIIIIRRRRVGHSIDKAVILSVGVYQAGGMVHRFVSHQVSICALDDIISRVKVRSAVLASEHLPGEGAQGRCTCGDWL